MKAKVEVNFFTSTFMSQSTTCYSKGSPRVVLLLCVQARISYQQNVRGVRTIVFTCARTGVNNFNIQRAYIIVALTEGRKEYQETTHS